MFYFKDELKTREKCVQFGQFASSYLVILDRSLLWRPHSHYTCWQHWWLVTHQRDNSWHRDTHSPSVITSQSWKSNSVLTLSCSHLAPASTDSPTVLPPAFANTEYKLFMIGHNLTPVEYNKFILIFYIRVYLTVYWVRWIWASSFVSR